MTTLPKKNFPILNMATLAQVYRHYRDRISLRGFMRLVGQPSWRLRIGAAKRPEAHVVRSGHER